MGAGLTWRKELVLHANDGERIIGVQDSTHSAHAGLHRHRLKNGYLLFRKAKLFGIMTDVHRLESLDQLPTGAQVKFHG